MAADAALELADALLFARTGKHLSDLQCIILQTVWLRQTYGEIASQFRYTEGHVKDVASDLWRSLSVALNERVTKSNCRAVLERRLATEGMGLSPALGEALPVETLSLVGRQGAIAALQARIARGDRAVVLWGEGGIGKTTLAQAFLDGLGCDRQLELLMAKETATLTPVEQIVEEWLRQDFQVEPGRDFGVTLDRLKRQLREQRVGILIDNLEPALDRQGRFWPAQSGYGELLRVLCDPKAPTITVLTSRDRLCEPGLPISHYRLPGLEGSAWQQFFAAHSISLADSNLAAMHGAYGGNAKAMTLLVGAIAEDFDGDGDSYWVENAADPLVVLDLKNLISGQVSRLKSLDVDAYRLFCRLGAYRYQDVSRIPTEAIFAQLWDVEPERRRQVLVSLRNRSLLEQNKGQYWLHPAVQAEALAHLRHSADFEAAHRHAAQFWTAHVTTFTTVEDVTQAFEAYNHAIALQDYPAAAAVLLHSRHNQWGQYLTLGSTLYRMGLLQPLLVAIPPILPHLPEGPQASELRNILADVCWISGQIHRAIALQKDAYAIAHRALTALPESAEAQRVYHLKMLQVDAQLSLGLYDLDLWELANSAAHFEHVIATATNSPHQGWADKAALCLALVESYQPDPTVRDRAHAQADRAYQQMTQPARPDYTGRFAFFLQLLGQTYANLGHRDRAAELYRRAIAFAEESHYIQVQAKAETGLGQLARGQGDPQTAIARLSTAIDRLQDLGAQSDLAEAHFQLALTYHAKGDPAAAHHRRQAIHHFSAIAAPRQVAKVQLALPTP